MRRKLIVGNWKMNGLTADGCRLARDLLDGLAGREAGCEVAVCPPAHLLVPVAEVLQGSPVLLGAQDCHPAPSGAHTGDISAEMLADVGCRLVIVGHSERRQDHGESDNLVQRKAAAALRAGLLPIVCVGETAAQREAGQTLAVIERQVGGSLPAAGETALVVAYEPVWAIGTGRSATVADVAEVHGAIRAQLRALLGDEAAAEVRILYGGSVKPDNAAALLAAADVDGALVGGASLQAEAFCGIIAAA